MDGRAAPRRRDRRGGSARNARERDSRPLHPIPASVPFAVTGFAGRVVLVTAGTTYDLGTTVRTPRLLTLPDDKRLTGKRDLSFVLVRPDGSRPANREARATVYGVLLAGRR